MVEHQTLNLRVGGSSPPASAMREKIARAIYAVKPDCQGKPWPIETPEQRRAYPHNPIASVDLCYIYADAAIRIMDNEN